MGNDNLIFGRAEIEGRHFVISAVRKMHSNFHRGASYVVSLKY